MFHGRVQKNYYIRDYEESQKRAHPIATIYTKRPYW